MVTLGLIAASVGSVYLVVHEYEVDVGGHMGAAENPACGAASSGASVGHASAYLFLS